MRLLCASQAGIARVSRAGLAIGTIIAVAACRVTAQTGPGRRPRPTEGLSTAAVAHTLFALAGQRANSAGGFQPIVVVITDGRKTRAFSGLDALGNYVPAWGAFAASNRAGVLFAVSLSGSKPMGVAKMPTDNSLFAVSPDGKLVAANGEPGGILEIRRVADAHLVLRATASRWRKRGLSVGPAAWTDTIVPVFSSTMRAVYVNWPSNARPGTESTDGSVSPRTVRVPLDGGRPAIVGKGILLGFVGPRQVLQTRDGLAVGTRRLRLAEAQYPSLCRAGVAVVDQQTGAVRLYDSELRPLGPPRIVQALRHRIVWAFCAW